MKEILKSNKARGFFRTEPTHVNRIVGPAPGFDKEVVPASEAHKPVFSTSNLAISPPQTDDDIRRLLAEGRFAEMTPEMAG